MRRFFLPPENFKNREILLAGEIFHYLKNVLRLAPGEDILLQDGRGLVCRCCLEAAGRNQFKALVQEQWWEKDSAFPLHLIQALPKSEKMDWLLQKCTELGVKEFSPVITRRTIPVISGERMEKRIFRWRRIVEEAARQSGRPCVPVVNEPRKFDDVLSSCREEYRIVCWEEESLPLAAALPGEKPSDAAVFIGPEGGLEAEEVKLLKKSRFQAVSLGPRILRTETAGFTVAAIFQYLYGDIGKVPQPGKFKKKD